MFYLSQLFTSFSLFARFTLVAVCSEHKHTSTLKYFQSTHLYFGDEPLCMDKVHDSVMANQWNQT